MPDPAPILDLSAPSTDRGTKETTSSDAFRTGSYHPAGGDLLPPEYPTIPGYLVLGVLGQGGMGVVYRARQERLKRDVALKMVLAGGHASTGHLVRFKSEAESVARLQHPNIVQVFEAGEANGYPFMVLELVPGGSLAEKIRETPLAARPAAELVRTLALAVDHAHRSGVVHRDLKPANVLLAADGTPKVGDFGLARLIGEDSGQTRDGAVLGTPSYMAPEQASGSSQSAGPAADVYALGAILYAALTGRAPFKAATVLDTLEQVRSQEPVPPARLQPTVPRDLETICLTCLQKDPRRRYAAAAALADDLGRFLRDEPIAARRVGPIERGRKWARRHPGVAVLSGVLLTAVLAGVSVVTVLWRSAVLARLTAETNETWALNEAARANQKTAEVKAGLRKERADRYAARLVNAERAWRDLHVALTLDLLRQQVPSAADLADPEIGGDPRGFEWHYLWRQAHAGRVLAGHTAHLNRVVFSPDGQFLASGADDNTCRLWDPKTGACLRVLAGHEPFGGKVAHVVDLAFSPDGSRLATAGHEGTVRIWDPKTGNEVFVFRDYQQDVTDAKRRSKGDMLHAVSFGSDGRIASAGRAYHSIRLWDAGAGTVHLRFPGYWCATLSPDGRRLAGVADPVDGQPKAIKVWDTTDGKELLHLPTGTYSTEDLRFGPGNRLAWAGWEYFGDREAKGEVRVWDGETGKVLRTFAELRRIPQAVALSPDGKRLAVAFSARNQPEGEGRVWDIDSGVEALTLRGHLHSFATVAFSPDGNTLASGGSDQTVRLWDARERQDARVFSLGKSPLLSAHTVSFAPDGRLASGNILQVAHVWDPLTGRQLHALRGPEGKKLGHHAVAFSPDGTALAAAGHAGTVRLWDLPAGATRFTVPMHRDSIEHLFFLPDGRRLVTGTRPMFGPGEWRMLDTATGVPTGPPRRLDRPLRSLALSADGRYLAWGTGTLKTGEARVEDFATGEVLFTLGGHGGFVDAIAFDPRGRWVATGSYDHAVRVWDLASGELRHVLTGHTAQVNALVFDPVGRRLASASGDRTVKLWDPEYGQETFTIRGHPSMIRDVAFSRDGHLLATAGSDGTVRVWDGTPDPSLEND